MHVNKIVQWSTVCSIKKHFCTIVVTEVINNFFYSICLIFNLKYYIVSLIENENKQMWFASKKEVRRMIEVSILIEIIYILYYSLIGISIITFALIIALVVIISKGK